MKHCESEGMLASPNSASNNVDSLGCELSLDQTESHNPAWHALTQSVGLDTTKPFDIGPVHLTLRKLVLCETSSDSAVREENAQTDVAGRTVDLNLLHRRSKDLDIIRSMVIVLVALGYNFVPLFR